MEIAFVTSEITPYSRSGEVGDVCAALPKALRSIGHKVTVVSPLWSGIDPAARGLARRLTGVEAELSGKKYPCTLHDGRTTGGVELLFIGQSELLAGGPETGDGAIRGALVFAQAAMQALAARSPAPDVVHAHGWFAAPVLTLCERALPQAVRVLSLHDARLRGALAGLDLGLPESLAALSEGGRDASLLRAGIAAAERVVASSQAEAYTLLAGAHAASNLRDVLATPETKLLGVRNGVDAARWNPLTDPLLPARFDHADLRGKARCKDALQLELELPVRPELPVFAYVGEPEAGPVAALLQSVATPLLRNDAQLVIATSKGAAALDSFRALREKYRERLGLALGADERTQHLAIGAADFVLVPERDPVHGELYACAQRYGALPVAVKAFAMADGVIDCDAELTTGTGFTFDQAAPEAVVAALQRALSAFQKPKAFAELRRRTMRIDLSWERSARSYEHAYKGARPQSR